MISPVRSFNLDKIALKYRERETLDNGFLLNSKISYQFAEELKFGANASFEIWFEKLTESGLFDSDLFNLFDSKLKFSIKSDGNLYIYATSQQPLFVYSGLQLDHKYQATLVRLGPKYSLYIDGQYITTGGSLSNIISFSNLDNNLPINSQGVEDTVLLYSISLWNVSLSQQEIYSKFIKGEKYLASNISKLIAHWTFLDQDSNIVKDVGPNSIYGYIENFSPHKLYNPYSQELSPTWRKTSSLTPYINNTTFNSFIAQKDDAFSVEGWIHLHSGLSTDLEILKFVPNSGIPALNLFITSNTYYPSLRIRDRTVSQFLATHDLKSVSLNNWNHVGASWQAGDTVILTSLNGEVKSTNFFGTPKGLNLLTNLSGLMFGGEAEVDVSFRNWRIYSKKLTQEELIKCYKYPTERPVSNDKLVAEWKFIESNTHWAYDCSNHGNYLYPSNLNSTWESIDKSGFYPLLWDGYDLCISNGNIVANSYLNFSPDNSYITSGNIIIESLFFKAYESNPTADSYPFGVYYGPYIQIESGLGQIKYTQYTSGIFEDYKLYNPAFSNNSILASDGKWHHVIAMKSNETTLSGTNYNVIAYHNGKLAHASSTVASGVHQNNVGELFLGYNLNGAIRLARLYSSPNSSMKNWFNGTNVYNSPIYAMTRCFTGDPQTLVFDLDMTSNSGLDLVSDNTYSLINNTSIDRIPLDYKYVSVAGNIPKYPTPKFAISPILSSEYSLQCTFRLNVDNFNESIYILNDDVTSFFINSGLYFVQSNILITSGIIPSYKWNEFILRTKGGNMDLILNGKIINSGIISWSNPGDVLKWGFYANSPKLEKAVDIKRIAIYDQWLGDDQIRSAINVLLNLDFMSSLYQ